MTLLRALLMLSILTTLIQSFPSTTRDYKKESTSEAETKEFTSILKYTKDPQTMLDTQTYSEGALSIEEYVFKHPKEGLGVRKGSANEKYIITNLHTKNEDEKLNLLVSSKENEINIDHKDELYKLNITGISKNDDLLSETQIKNDQWLFNPQEMSSILGEFPKYFYDAIKPINPFPELSETVKLIHPLPELSETLKHNHTIPALVEKIYESTELGGPRLYPKSILIRDIDDSFFSEM